MGKEASGRELDTWSRGWLETAGVDRIAVDRASATITRRAPEAYPADRPHAFDVATYDGGNETSRVALTLDADSAPVPDLDVEAPLLVPNAGDLTWATPYFDAQSLDALRGQLPLITDAQTRAVIWVGLRDGAILGSGHALGNRGAQAAARRAAGGPSGTAAPSASLEAPVIRRAPRSKVR